MGIFGTAVAETTDLSTALEGLTTEEAAAAGAVVGGIIGVSIALLVVWFILQVIADWKIFTKAGEAGWKSIIPVYNYYVEYNICWKGVYGLVFGIAYCVVSFISQGGNVPNWQSILMSVLAIVMLILHIMESVKLAKSFGKGTGFGIFLILLGPIARMVLGFGKSKYVGKR